MADSLVNLFCLVDGETLSNAFPVEIESSKTIGNLKKIIKTENPNTFNGVDAKDLTLCRVSISISDEDNNDLPVPLVNDYDKVRKKLGPTDDVSDVFPDKPPKKTIHIIVQRPPPGQRLWQNKNSCGPPVEVMGALLQRRRCRLRLE
ncbi:hypothetical protein BGX24_004261 [Mortierella sp. AD032]|nr:hypothetical protein BGX24_004261 [Mortierella sp. AD032]